MPAAAGCPKEGEKHHCSLCRMRWLEKQLTCAFCECENQDEPSYCASCFNEVKNATDTEFERRLNNLQESTLKKIEERAREEGRKSALSYAVEICTKEMGAHGEESTATLKSVIEQLNQAMSSATEPKEISLIEGNDQKIENDLKEMDELIEGEYEKDRASRGRSRE